MVDIPLPQIEYFLGRAVPFNPRYRIAAYRGKGTSGYVFRAESEQLRGSAACKIVPKSTLRSNWQNEFQNANVAASLHRSVVRVFDFGDWIVDDSSAQCVALLSEWVNGPSLAELLRDSRDDVTLPFCEDLLKELLGLLNAMQQRGVTHGDLHPGNIMIEDRSAALSEPRFAFRVTDFGVASASDQIAPKDDFDQTAVVLRKLLEVLTYQDIGSPRDRFAYNYLNDTVLRHLTERDQAHDQVARRPREIFQVVNDIDRAFVARQRAAATMRLATPFDYPNCEQIGDAHGLMDALYSERFLGLSIIEQRSNLVLTGPRGCGKTTVFRSLSLTHRVLVDKDAPATVGYVGVYYRCDDLWSAFPRYKSPEREDAIDIPIHFLMASLLAELLESLEMWARRHFDDEFSRREEQVTLELWRLLEKRPPRGPITFKSLSAWLQRQRRYAVGSQKGVNNPKQRLPNFFTVRTLPAACELLLQALSFLGERPIYFLIDDFSAPKISEALQENLNRLLMYRSAACFFKISTESTVSFVPRDIDGKHYVESREYFLVNLGVDFIYADAADKLRFIDDVFERRLKAVPDYPAEDLHALIGDGPGVSANELARRIRYGEKPELWGREALHNLSSGDIHFLIQLLAKMVTLAGGPEALARRADVPKVELPLQNKAIRDEAGSFLRNLRGLERGAQLVEIVSAFGSVAHSYLRHRNAKNEEGHPPHQASRIEPYEDLTFSGEALELYRDLLRYAVFIEDVRGKSRRGRVVPRLHLRRFLIPHFNLTFSRRDAVELEPHELEELLLHPRNFENRMRLRRDEGDRGNQQYRLPMEGEHGNN